MITKDLRISRVATEDVALGSVKGLKNSKHWKLAHELQVGQMVV